MTYPTDEMFEQAHSFMEPPKTKAKVNAHRLRRRIYRWVTEERKRQDVKFGNQENHPDPWWHIILAEEVGEVARAIRESKPIGEILGELVQVAAVTVAWMEALGRREKEGPKP